MWITSRHVDDEELLLAADGELESRRKAALEAHVVACDACRTRRHELATTLERMSTLLESAPAEATQASSYRRVRLAAALRAAAHEDTERWIRLPLAPAAISTRHLAVGAGLMVMLVTGALLGARVTQGRVDRDVVRSALPVPELTPGAVSTLTAGELCAGARPSRLVTDATRRQVLGVYGMEHVATRTYELDALVTPELGGTTDAANLWPQRYQSTVWNARVKDELEQLLPELVCSGRLELSVAQRAIAADWVVAYQQFFKTDRPLRAHLGDAVDDEPELVLLPPDRVFARANTILTVALAGR
jgi:hypothetical protein